MNNIDLTRESAKIALSINIEDYVELKLKKPDYYLSNFDLYAENADGIIKKIVIKK